MALQPQSVEALESDGNVDLTLVPDVDGTLALLLVEVLCVVVDEYPLNLTKLSEESWLPDRLFLGEFSRQTNDIEKVWNDHAELLHFQEICLLMV